MFWAEAVCRSMVSDRMLVPRMHVYATPEVAARALSRKFRQNFVPFANEAGEAVVQLCQLHKLI
jgi:hypothetical protein